MLLGASIANWLRTRINPSRVYDHRVLAELEPLGIFYDLNAHQLWMHSGEIANVPVYTPAQLLNHPVVEIANVYDPGPDALSTLGFELSAAIHELVWPAERPPGRVEEGWQECFADNVASIATRGDLPYREMPPGGWWRTVQPMTTRRRR